MMQALHFQYILFLVVSMNLGGSPPALHEAGLIPTVRTKKTPHYLKWGVFTEPPRYESTDLCAQLFWTG
jgi:hypothetical protein